MTDDDDNRMDAESEQLAQALGVEREQVEHDLEFLQRADADRRADDEFLRVMQKRQG